jgi:hypothetical protein
VPRPGRIPRVARRFIVVALFLAVSVKVTAGPAYDLVSAKYERYQVTRPSYEKSNGRWDIVSLPAKYQVHAIHAALLRTGKVLIIAGSGNDEDDFKAGTFKTLLWDPAKGTGDDALQLIPTPADLFCGGHAFLPNGNLLIAGGTAKYEVLGDAVKYAAGVMTVKDESPDGTPTTFPKGTKFVSPSGLVFESTDAVTVPTAKKVQSTSGAWVVTAGSAQVWVQAVKEGSGSVVSAGEQYTISSVAGKDSKNLYGYADSLTLDKQEYGGLRDAYEFDVATSSYQRVGFMNDARWYPTLTRIPGNKILAVSGLDQFGVISNGENEIFDPATGKWTVAKNAFRYFPTYPSLIMTASGKLFYSGSNAGYGSATAGRTPGVWDVTTNTFQEVPGLPVPQDMETSGTILLPPAQDQKVMVIGGGGIGDSDESTDRTAIVDLSFKDPKYVQGPSLCVGTRYPSSVVLPNDTVLVTGGSEGYRGSGDSDIHKAQIYDPSTNTFDQVASPRVGRDYHSEALLLPDGRVVTLGSDPLYGNASDTLPGTFENRLEIYTPAYLYTGVRPVVSSGPTQLQRSRTYTFTVPNAADIVRARLVRPSAVTHMTDSEQSSVALDVHGSGDQLTVTVPANANLLPDDWYMFFVTNADGTPNNAYWVHVS